MIGTSAEGTRMSLTEEKVVETLRKTMDPELHRSLVELGMVKRLSIEDGKVKVTISLTIPECPLRDMIKADVEKNLLNVEGVKEVEVIVTSMTPRERRMLFEEVEEEEGEAPKTYASGR